MFKSSRTAEIILKALPYIKRFTNKIFVVKYGGAAQIDENLKNDFARDLVLLQLVGIKLVIVHGGGNKISSFLEALNLQSEFIDGLRLTDQKTMEIVEMTLSGLINKEIVSLLNKHGARAIGLSGKDDNMLIAKSLNDGKYGFVGEITNVNEKIILNLLENGLIPVIAPIATSKDYKSFNINADLCAAEIAIKLNAKKVIFLSDIQGVLDKEGNLINKLDEKLIQKYKEDGTIIGGMIPKIDACLRCIKNKVEAAHIINGKLSHALLLEIFTDEGIGSVIK